MERLKNLEKRVFPCPEYARRLKGLVEKEFARRGICSSVYFLSEEYTDYRSYLDYDIEIHKRDGSVQSFSDIYGEKSGSETQVPYHVAIAASFYQFTPPVKIKVIGEKVGTVLTAIRVGQNSIV